MAELKLESAVSLVDDGCRQSFCAPRWMLALSVIAAQLLGQAGAQAQEKSVPSPTGAAQLNAIRDTQSDPSLRRDAATSMALSAAPGDLPLLLNELKCTNDPAIRRAIVSGLRQANRATPAAAGQMMLAVLPELEAGLVEDAAEVLGRCDDAEVARQITIIASDRRQSETARLITVGALGLQQTQASAAVLMALLDPRQPAAIRSAVFASLSRLSGQDDLGADRERWASWWMQARAMSPAQWRDHLLTNFTRRSETVSRQYLQLKDRLSQALRQRYRAVPKEQRQTVLVEMLQDKLDAVRDLGLELTRELVGTETIAPQVTTALLAMLDDPAPNLRSSATLLLRDLKSEAAADIVATRLAEDRERNRTVLRAYLAMMRRQPRIGAIASAITLLDDPVLRGDAAGALLAAFDHEPSLIGAAQAGKVADRLHQHMDETSPEPRFVELLGRVGDGDDWRRIAGWLKSESPEVREAAAKAWVRADRMLATLAQHADDPIIASVLIPASARRGSDAVTLLALARNKPKADQLVPVWGNALVAMAPRVPSEAAVAVDELLRRAGEASDLRQQFLSAAINRLLLRIAPGEFNGYAGSQRITDTLQLIDLLIARAEVRLAASDAKGAEADLSRVAERRVDLALEQANRIELIALRAKLGQGDVDDAFLLAGRYFSGELETDNDIYMRKQVTDALLIAAGDCLKSKQADRAATIISRLRARLPRPLTLDAETRLTLFEERIRSATKPEEPAKTP